MNKTLTPNGFNMTFIIVVVDWLVGWFYGVSILFGSFNAELNFKQSSLV